MRRVITIGALVLSGLALAACSGQSGTAATPSPSLAVGTTPPSAVAAPSATAGQPEPSAIPTGSLDAALVKQIEDRAKANPNDAAAQLDLGDLYFVTKEFDKALATYQKVVKLAPDDTAAWTALGAAAYSSGDNEQARDAFLKAVTLDPSNQEAHYDIAFAYLSLVPPETANATSALQRAVDLNPESAIGQAAQQMLTSMASASPSPE